MHRRQQRDYDRKKHNGAADRHTRHAAFPDRCGKRPGTGNGVILSDTTCTLSFCAAPKQNKRCHKGGKAQLGKQQTDAERHTFPPQDPGDLHDVYRIPMAGKGTENPCMLRRQLILPHQSRTFCRTDGITTQIAEQPHHRKRGWHVQLSVQSQKTHKR